MPGKESSLDEFHPQVAPLIKAFREGGAVSFESVSLEQSRANYRSSCAANGFAAEAVASVDDLPLSMPGQDPVLVRMYRPAGSHPEEFLPAIMYIHGGGWVIGDLETHDGLCRTLCNESRSAVIAVDYRLAPEHPFPVPLDDCRVALDALVEQAEELRLDVSKLVLCGDSAGANMAAVLAHMSARGEAPPINSQILFYPVTDLQTESEGYERVKAGVPLTAASMRWFRNHYLRSDTYEPQWHHSPIHAGDFDALPGTFIVTAGHDPLAEEGIEYAQRLSLAEVDVEHHHLADHSHGIFTSGRVLDAARRLLTDAVGFVQTRRESS